jgi:biotin operon repressor
MDPAVRSQIQALRDSGKIVHLYGRLLSNVPDCNGSQIQVDRIEVQGYLPGSSVTPGTSEKIANWWGIIKSNKPGAQFDDCFERRDLGQVISFGIDSMDPAVRSQIQALRDSGKIVHLYGTLLSNVPDCNGSQIQVDRVEVEG